ncbi:MAG: SDR family NAD(P)-dependent oxidoreductase [Elusimicrobia bacterium]|nr:SDR family NAD(P)-dependent oxidoreductase [Elusimicrobiota bacterium]
MRDLAARRDGAPTSSAPTRPAVTAEDARRAAEILEALLDRPELAVGLDDAARVRLLTAAGRLSRPSKFELKSMAKSRRKERRRTAKEGDRAARAATGIRTARAADVFAAPARALPAPDAPERVLSKPQACYVCKASYVRLHHFYDGMCPDCAEFNYAKRFQTADLSGRAALLTGARLKIGYQAALKLLRAGAEVTVSTRFPHDAAARYAAEPDFKDWGARLRVHGLDLRHSPSVEVFARYLCSTRTRLDALISNAAQTVRRPVAFYEHLLPGEARGWKDLSAAERTILGGHYELRAALDRREPASAADQKALTTWDGGALGVGLRESARLSQVRMTYDDRTRGEGVFPAGRLDADLQQVDLRATNTWRMTLADVPTPELLEVLLINAVAPFVLAARLKPLMLAAGTREVHVVNVSAMEGIFSRGTKTDKHPHTNMAKAALNMLTLTSAPDYAKDGIWMNAVDTGWVTDEDPVVHSLRKQEIHDFQPPLDVVDGAARILDPLFVGLNTGVHESGKFFKDYKPAAW